MYKHSMVTAGRYIRGHIGSAFCIVAAQCNTARLAQCYAAVDQDRNEAKGTCLVIATAVAHSVCILTLDDWPPLSGDVGK